MNVTQVWIGLAHVRPQSSNDLLEGALGAFVPAVALAANVEDFTGMATTALRALGFDVIEVDDIEQWTVRTTKFQVSEDMRTLVQSLTPEQPIALGTFDSYAAE